MLTYWASGIAFDEKNDKKPWLWFCSECELSLEEAKRVIACAKENYNLISAWVDCLNENNESTVVYHECFIDAFGNKSR